MQDRDATSDSFIHDLETELKNKNLQGEKFNLEKMKALKSQEEIDTIQNGIITSLTNLLDLIEDNLGKFSIKENDLIFNDPLAQEKYTDLMIQLQIDNAKQTEFYKNMKESAFDKKMKEDENRDKNKLEQLNKSTVQ